LQKAKPRAYNGAVSAFHTAEQFGLIGLMKEAGAELSARDIAAGLYRRANRRNKKCGFTQEEISKIALNAVALNIGEPEGLSLYYAAKTIRKYAITYKELDLAVSNYAYECGEGGRKEDGKLATDRFNFLVSKVFPSTA
jgi:hypothetical protein